MCILRRILACSWLLWIRRLRCRVGGGRRSIAVVGVSVLITRLLLVGLLGIG